MSNDEQEEQPNPNDYLSMGLVVVFFIIVLFAGYSIIDYLNGLLDR